MRIEKIYNNFFLRFICISAGALLVWKPVSQLYLHVLAPVANVVLSILNPAVQVQLIDGILRYRYTGITPQLLQFSVNEADQIYLNSIVFFALLASSYRVPYRLRLKYFAIGQIFLMLIHVGVLVMYVYTNIWDFASYQPEMSRELLTSRIETYFPSGLTELFGTLIYYWNSWGWDVLPLLLWFPIGLKQFSPVTSTKRTTA